MSSFTLNKTMKVGQHVINYFFIKDILSRPMINYSCILRSPYLVFILQNSRELEKRNQDLREQAEELKTEKEYLNQLLQEHLAVCPNRLGGCRP